MSPYNKKFKYQQNGIDPALSLPGITLIYGSYLNASIGFKDDARLAG